MTTMTMPASAHRSLRNCRQKISHGERPMTSFGAMTGVGRRCGLRRVDEFLCCEVALDVPWLFSYRGSHVRSIPPARQSSGRMLRQETAIVHHLGLRHASGPRAGARYRYRGDARATPSAHARSPNAVEPSDVTPPPLTRSGTGSAVCAFRTHEVEWSAVTATIVVVEVEDRQDLAEERRRRSRR